MSTITTPALAGRELRYVLTVALHQADRPLTVAELVAILERDGLRVAGRSSKTVSDALRWEIGNGRVLKVGRSTYRRGTMPRSTAWWIRQHLRDRGLL
ncbi:MAG: hypothetical protein ACT452_06380 [Microthrixaceae bacterium]